MSSEVTLEDYQSELAKPSLEGHNNIIFAPLGSGKTLISGYIANEILKKKKNKCKIFFIITEQRLGQQKVEEFGKMIPKGVIKLITDTDHLKKEYCSNSVFVSTPQILMNGLDHQILKFSDIDLLILDHYATSQYIHQKLMVSYLQAKEDKTQGGKLPQVIGLTSSLGLENCENPNDQLASLHVFFDHGVTVVTKHSDQLQHLTPESNTEEVIKVSPRDKDSPFGKQLEEIMRWIESQATFPSKPYPIGTQRYESWVRTYKYEQIELDSQDAMKKVESCDALLLYSEALHIYYQVQAQNALNILDKNFTENTKNATTQYIIEKYHDIKRLLEILAKKDEVQDNHKLNWLRSKLIEVFSKNEDSRVLVLTNTIEESKALCDFVKSHEWPKNIVPGTFVGRRQRKYRTNIEEQFEVIDQFKKGPSQGGINLLISTDGFKAGLDIPKCNAIIRYDYVSIIVPGPYSKDCKVYAIKYNSSDGQASLKRSLPTVDTRHVMEQLNRWKASGTMEQDIRQKRSEIMERNAKKNQVNIGKDPGDKYTIECKKCKTILCKGNEILKKGSHHLCIKENFDKMLDFIGKTERVFKHDKNIGVNNCKKCNSQLGPMIIFNQEKPRSEGFCLNMKAIRIKKGLVKIKSDKWTKVPFHINEEPLFVADKKSSSIFLDELSQEIDVKEWRRVGIRLGISDSKLDNIEQNNPRNAAKSIYQMLRLWWEDRQQRQWSVLERCSELIKTFDEDLKDKVLQGWVENYQDNYIIFDEKDEPSKEWENHETFVLLAEVKDIFKELKLKDSSFNNTREDQRRILLKYGHIALFNLGKPDEKVNIQEELSIEEKLVQNPQFLQAAMGYFVSYRFEQEDHQPWEDMEEALLAMEKKEERNKILKFCMQYSSAPGGKIKEFYKKAFTKQEGSKDRLLLLTSAIAAHKPPNAVSMKWEDIKFLCKWTPDQQHLEDFKGQAELLLQSNDTSSLGIDTILSRVCVLVGDRKVKNALEEKRFCLKEGFLFIENDEIPEIEWDQHSIAWVVLKQCTYQCTYKTLQSICETSKHPFGIDISEPKMSKEMPDIIKLLAECKHVTHVCIDMSKQRWKTIKESLPYLEALMERKALNELVLRDCHLDVKTVPALVTLVFMSDGLYALDLSNNPGLLKDSKGVLSKALEEKAKKMISLKEFKLNLSTYDTTLDAKDAMSKLLKCSPNIEVLAVKLCTFDLSKSIINLSGLTSLDISKTFIKLDHISKGMNITALFKNVRLLTKLKYFGAGWCHITEETIKHLELDEHSELEVLHLDYNQLGDRGFVVLAEKLNAVSTLKELYISQNHITTVELQHSMGTLEVLDLSHNKIPQECARNLCCELRSCENFKRLCLKEMMPPIDPKFAENFSSSLIEF